MGLEGGTGQSAAADIAIALEEATKREMSKLASRAIDPENTRGRPRRRTAVAENSGSAQLTEMLRLLDCFGLKRSRVQKQLHLGMAGAVLQRIFCSDSDANMRVAMLQHNITSCRQQFMSITPRRFGKTTAVAMFVAAFALAIPGTTTAIFSTGRRASNLLLQQIKNMMTAIPGAADKIVASNVETITLDAGSNMFSKVSSFPGKART